MRTIYSAFVLFLLSCGDERRLDYATNRPLYDSSISCLTQNRHIFLNDQGSQIQSVSIYKGELQKFGFCEKVDALFSIEPIEFIVVERNETVSFYSKVNRGLKQKQVILFFSKDSTDLFNKFGKHIQFKKINKEGWYELEKIMSLAN